MSYATAAALVSQGLVSRPGHLAVVEDTMGVTGSRGRFSARGSSMAWTSRSSVIGAGPRRGLVQRPAAVVDLAHSGRISAAHSHRPRLADPVQRRNGHHLRTRERRAAHPRRRDARKPQPPTRSRRHVDHRGHRRRPQGRRDLNHRQCPPVRASGLRVPDDHGARTHRRSALCLGDGHRPQRGDDASQGCTAVPRQLRSSTATGRGDLGPG